MLTLLEPMFLRIHGGKLLRHPRFDAALQMPAPVVGNRPALMFEAIDLPQPSGAVWLILDPTPKAQPSRPFLGWLTA
jgi:hypothetical protein